jgi:hypothetical protein
MLQNHKSGWTEGKIQTILELVVEDPEVQKAIQAALELRKREGHGDGDALEQLLAAANNKWLHNAPIGVCGYCVVLMHARVRGSDCVFGWVGVCAPH